MYITIVADIRARLSSHVDHHQSGVHAFLWLKLMRFLI
jgi:hypothetical protein